MSEVNIPPFYVGQKVICVHRHNNGLPIKGHTYFIKSIHQYPCCGNWVVNYGEKLPIKEGIKSTCCKCHISHPPFNNGCYVVPASWFAPIQENFQSITLEKVLEQETKLVGAN